MEVRTELISHLREKFFKKLDDEGPPDPSVYTYSYFKTDFFLFNDSIKMWLTHKVKFKLNVIFQGQCF